MNDNRREILFLYLVAEAFKLYVSEAEEGVIGLNAMLLSVAEKNSLRLCGAIVCIVEISVAVKRFAVADNRTLALLTFYSELDLSRYILTEINDGLALGSCNNFLCGEALMLNDLFAEPVFKRRFAAGEHLCSARLKVNI